MGNDRYFQTWHYLVRIRRLPVIGKGIYKAFQFLCSIKGHHISKTEWGYGGGDRVDVWCRWCNYNWNISHDEARFRFPWFNDHGRHVLPKK